MAGRRLFTVYRANGKRELVTEKDLFDLVLIVGDRDSIYGADYYHEGVHLQYYYNAKKETWFIRKPRYILLKDFKDYTYDQLRDLAETQLELGCVFRNGDILIIKEFVYVDRNSVVAHGYSVVYRALEMNNNSPLVRSYTHHLPQYWALWRLDDALEGFINRIKQGELNRPLSNSLKDLFGA